MEKTSRQKGDLLEQIVGRLCAGIENAKTEINAKITGRSGVTRQVDTLIRGKVGAFEVEILVDSKNHANPVDINCVDSMEGMVKDVGANLGVIVCPAGFTDGAKKRAESANIQLYEIYDQALGNTKLFIPLRYIEARISKYNFEISHRALGPFSLAGDSSRWQIYAGDKVIRADEIPAYIWNKEMIPQEKGDYSVKIGAVKIVDIQDNNQIQYCDLSVGLIVVEDYYLKLFPASFLRKTGGSRKEYFNLRIDIYSKKEDMLKNGWKYFQSLEEMNKAADIENQPTGVRGVLFRNHYSIVGPNT
ncbi:MAG: restriction endonuclease [bacterium]|nr:restriction endonuclease [bacterium]